VSWDRASTLCPAFRGMLPTAAKLHKAKAGCGTAPYSPEAEPARKLAEGRPRRRCRLPVRHRSTTFSRSLAASFRDASRVEQVLRRPSAPVGERDATNR